MADDKLVYFTARGEPLPDDTEADDVRIAFQLRGKDAKDKAKEYNKAREQERELEATTVAKAEKAAKAPPEDKAVSGPQESKTSEPEQKSAAPEGQDAPKPGAADQAVNQDTKRA